MSKLKIFFLFLASIIAPLCSVSVISKSAAAANFTGVATIPTDVLFNPDTGHYYKLVAGSPSWQEAKQLAESSFYQEMQGYLVTITSQAENDFLVSNFGNFNHIWIGASDAEEEGKFKWMTGPEAGTVFWENGVAKGYTNWVDEEPNNFAGKEHYLEFNSTGEWNDVPITHIIQGYFVEYSPTKTVPEPSSMLGLLAFGAFGISSLLKHKHQENSRHSNFC